MSFTFFKLIILNGLILLVLSLQDDMAAQLQQLQQQIQEAELALQVLTNQRNRLFGSNNQPQFNNAKQQDKCLKYPGVQSTCPSTKGESDFKKPIYKRKPQQYINDEQNYQQEEPNSRWIDFKRDLRKRNWLTVDYNIQYIEFINLKEARGTGDPEAAYVLLAVANDNLILLLSMRGRVQVVYNAGHDIYKIVFLNHQEQNTLTTLGRDWTVRTHLINCDKIESLEDGEVKRKRRRVQLTNFSIEAQNQFPIYITEQVQSNTTNIERFFTAFCGVFARNSKLYLLGDVQGYITVHHQNGTFLGRALAATAPILELLPHYPHPLFASSRSIGFFNLHSLKIAQPVCPQPPESILAVQQESQHSQTFFVLLNNFEVFIYEAKPQKSICTMLCKVNSGEYALYRNHSATNIAIFQNFLIVHNLYAPSAKIVNITNYKSSSYELLNDAGFYAYGLGTHLSAVKDDIKVNNSAVQYLYASKRHSSTLSFALFIESVHADNSTGTGLASSNLSFYEITQQPQSFSFNFLENVRFPMILVAIFVLFLIKYWNKNKGEDGGDASFNKEKIDSLIERMSKQPPSSGSAKRSDGGLSSNSADHTFV